MREINDEAMESVLANQIPEYQEPQETTPSAEVVEERPVEVAPVEPAEGTAGYYIGKKLEHNVNGIYGHGDAESDKEFVEKAHLTKIGENIRQNSDIRDGWMPVDKALLGERAKFYPEDWNFRIRPATVEAIRNWSTIDEENFNSVDDVFNEILKSCVSIVTAYGPTPVGNIRIWDRFFFIMLVREYTMIHGETQIKFTEECPNCDNPVEFVLSSQSLMYDMPDPEVMKYFSTEDQTWVIDPAEYEVEGQEPITLYLPTVEKEANIKAWAIALANEKKKLDKYQVFLKFLPWMAQKISKDTTIAKRQIREYEVKFNEWDTDMFSFMDEVINNIAVVPATKLKQICPTCGEEVTTDARFPNGIRALFNVSNRRKKFGKK